MLSQLVFPLVSVLLHSRLARAYAEHHGPQEESYSARIGPIQVSQNDCFVLDHTDANLTIPLSTRWGRLTVRLTACRGAEQIRQPGLSLKWQRPFPTS
jgi:hypothetical protein